MLCCRITTLTFHILTNFKISNFNKEHTSSLKKIRMMIETCWGVMLCCRITTLTFHILTNFKISDFNKEHTSSLKMI